MQFCCMNCKVFVSHSGRAALAGQGETMRYIPKSAGVRGGLLLMCKHNNRDLGFILSMVSMIRNHFSLTSWPHFVNMKHLWHKVNLRDFKDSWIFVFVFVLVFVFVYVLVCVFVSVVESKRSQSPAQTLRLLFRALSHFHLYQIHQISSESSEWNSSDQTAQMFLATDSQFIALRRVAGLITL